MSWDYGNARVASLRGRLLDAATLARLAEAETAAEFLALLERADDWRPIVRETAGLAADPAAAAEATIERYRAVRLGRLPTYYPPPARGLVEALVMPLDIARVVALVRRRLAGESPETIGASIVPGALLGGAALGELARAASMAALARGLAARGLLLPVDALAIAELAADPSSARLEALLVEGMEAARAARARGHDEQATRVRSILAAERADRLAVAAELRMAGPLAASLVERADVLARLDRLAAEGRRDPLGVGAVAGYIAGVEGQTVRLRACLARVVAGWDADLLSGYLRSD